MSRLTFPWRVTTLSEGLWIVYIYKWQRHVSLHLHSCNILIEKLTIEMPIAYRTPIITQKRSVFPQTTLHKSMAHHSRWATFNVTLFYICMWDSLGTCTCNNLNSSKYNKLKYENVHMTVNSSGFIPDSACL